MSFYLTPFIRTPFETSYRFHYAFLCRILALFIFPAFASPGKCADELIIHPAYPLASNAGAFGASGDYTVTINGQTAPVYSTTVKQLRWGGTGPRPTTTASFVPFDFSGSVTVTITAQVAITRLTIRPLSAGITPTISGNQATFTLTKAQPLLIEVNDSLASNSTTTPELTVSPSKPLFLFASPPQATPAATTTFTPSTFSASAWPTTAGTYVFGPGLYTIATLRLYSGQRLHLLPGALLQTTIDSTDTDGVSITGTGIIDGSTTGHKLNLLMDFNRCQNVTLDGPLLYNSPHWTVTLWNCQDVAISRIKVLNTHRDEGANGDGADICNSQGVTISDSFFYTTDDCISPKGCTWFDGHSNANQQNLEDLTVTNCTLMTSIGYAVRIGDETRAPFLRNITVRDCDIYVAGSAIGIQVMDSATVRDITFENIRIERYGGYPIEAEIDKNIYSTDAAYGKIKNLLFKDISVLSRYGSGASKFYGNDATASIDGVTFENFRMTGTEVKTFTSGQIYGKTVTSMVTPADDFIYNLIYRTGRPLINVTRTPGTNVRTISLSSPSSGASIYYTTNGTEPSNSNGTLYNGSAFNITVSPTPILLRAAAIASGLATSIITETTLRSTTPYVFTGTGSNSYSWATAGHWDTLSFPDMVGADAKVTPNISESTTLSLNQPVTLSILRIGDSAATTSGSNEFNAISLIPGAGGSLRFDTDGGSALLERPDVGTNANTYNNQVDQITANLQLDENLEVRIGNSSQAGGITLSGVISGSGGIQRTFHTTGTPSVPSTNSSLRLTNAANSYTGPTIISGGRLEVSGSVTAGANGPLGNATGSITVSDATTTGTTNNVAAELALLSTDSTSSHTFSRGLDFSQGTGSPNWRSAFVFNSNTTSAGDATNTLTLSGDVALGSRFTQINVQRRGMTLNLTGDITGGSGGTLYWNSISPGFSVNGGTNAGVIRLSNRPRTYSKTQHLTNGVLIIEGSVPASASSSPIGTQTLSLSDGNGGNIGSANGQYGTRSLFLDNDGTNFARTLSLGGGASSSYNGGSFNVYNGYCIGGVNTSGTVTFSAAISSANPNIGNTPATTQTITTGQNLALLAATGGTVAFTGVIDDTPASHTTRVTINQFRNHPQLDLNANGTPDTGGAAGSNANDLIGTPTGGTVILSANNGYAGGTEVLGGTLLANNIASIAGDSATGSGPVTVQSGARLGGTGTISGNVTLASGGGLAFTLSTIPGSHDKLDLGGGLSFAGSSTLVITTSGSAPTPGTYTLLSAASGTGSGTLPTLSLPAGWSGSLQRSGNNLNLLITGRTPQETWRTTHFGTWQATGSSADTADPDGDGLNNLLEYALNGTPTDATSAPLPTASLLPAPSSTLQLTFFRARPAADVTYTVQASSDLVTWTDLAINPGTVGQNVTVTDTPPTGAANRFLRLRVQPALP